MRTRKTYGKNADDFKGYVVLQGRSKVSILIDSWHEVDGDLKDNIWTDITVFIMSFLICFTSIYDHLFFQFNTNINSINYVTVGSVYYSREKYSEKEMDCIWW